MNILLFKKFTLFVSRHTNNLRRRGTQQFFQVISLYRALQLTTAAVNGFSSTSIGVLRYLPCAKMVNE